MDGPSWKNSMTISRGNAFSRSEYYLLLQKDKSKSGYDSKQDIYIRQYDRRQFMAPQSFKGVSQNSLSIFALLHLG